MWTCSTASTSGWAWIATASKPPSSPNIVKDGLSAPSPCIEVSGRMCSSRDRSGTPFTSRTGNHRAVEVAAVPRLRRPLLALDREGIDVGARETVLRRDEVGRDALRHEIGGDGDGGVDRPGAARRADADPAHRLDAAGDDEVVVAGLDRGRGDVDRVEPGGAVAVDLRSPARCAGSPPRPPRSCATSPPASPIGSTQPRITSPTAAGSRPFRVAIALERLRGEVDGGHLCSAPSFLPRPRGVRT